jgi:cbb3-type cytochrome oxidase subunit 3
MADASAPRVRRQRSLTESLLTIVLTLEAILVFFIALTVFGLHALSPALAFGGGAGLAILLLAATRVMRYDWGVWIGWVLQLVILSTGLVLPALYIAALFFIAIWVFCFVRGRQIDRQNAQNF